MTPEMIREKEHGKKFELVEQIKMDEKLLIDLEPPRFENGGRFLMAGLGGRYSCEDSAGIPSQWQRFLPHLGQVPGQVGRTAYGVWCNCDDGGNIYYVRGVVRGDVST